MDIPICSTKKGTALSRVIQKGKATVVDKAPMTNKLAFEALDRILRDLTGKDQPMGGMCMLLCGDFQQILPVIQGGTRGNIVDSCLKKSFLWDQVVVKHLQWQTAFQLYIYRDSKYTCPIAQVEVMCTELWIPVLSYRLWLWIPVHTAYLHYTEVMLYS